MRRGFHFQRALHCLSHHDRNCICGLKNSESLCKICLKCYPQEVVLWQFQFHGVIDALVLSILNPTTGLYRKNTAVNCLHRILHTQHPSSIISLIDEDNSNNYNGNTIFDSNEKVHEKLKKQGAIRALSVGGTLLMDIIAQQMVEKFSEYGSHAELLETLMEAKRILSGELEQQAKEQMEEDGEEEEEGMQLIEEEQQQQQQRVCSCGNSSSSSSSDDNSDSASTTRRRNNNNKAMMHLKVTKRTTGHGKRNEERFLLRHPRLVPVLSQVLLLNFTLVQCFTLIHSLVFENEANENDIWSHLRFDCFGGGGSDSSASSNLCCFLRKRLETNEPKPFVDVEYWINNPTTEAMVTDKLTLVAMQGMRNDFRYSEYVMLAALIAERSRKIRDGISRDSRILQQLQRTLTTKRFKWTQDELLKLHHVCWLIRIYLVNEESDKQKNLEQLRREEIQQQQQATTTATGRAPSSSNPTAILSRVDSLFRFSATSSSYGGVFRLNNDDSSKNENNSNNIIVVNQAIASVGEENMQKTIETIFDAFDHLAENFTIGSIENGMMTEEEEDEDMNRERHSCCSSRFIVERSFVHLSVELCRTSAIFCQQTAHYVTSRAAATRSLFLSTRDVCFHNFWRQNLLHILQETSSSCGSSSITNTTIFAEGVAYLLGLILLMNQSNVSSAPLLQKICNSKDEAIAPAKIVARLLISLDSNMKTVKSSSQRYLFGVQCNLSCLFLAAFSSDASFSGNLVNELGGEQATASSLLLLSEACLMRNGKGFDADCRSSLDPGEWGITKNEILEWLWRSIDSFTSQHEKILHHIVQGIVAHRGDESRTTTRGTISMLQCLLDTFGEEVSSSSQDSALSWCFRLVSHLATKKRPLMSNKRARKEWRRSSVRCHHHRHHHRSNALFAMKKRKRNLRRMNKKREVGEAAESGNSSSSCSEISIPSRDGNDSSSTASSTNSEKSSTTSNIRNLLQSITAKIDHIASTNRKETSSGGICRSTLAQAIVEKWREFDASVQSGGETEEEEEEQQLENRKRKRSVQIASPPSFQVIVN